jgi:stage V sporulation protein AF
MSENQIYVSKKLEENYEYIKDKIGIGISFDVGKRDLLLDDTMCHIYYVTGLINTDYVLQMMKELLDLNEDNKQMHKKKAFEKIKNHIIFQQVDEKEKMDEIITFILSGLAAVFVEGESKAFVVDLRSYPGRQPSEPETEKVIRGSKDGFTENIIINTALTRRRIRDPYLRHELIQIGDLSKTDVCITYIEGLADEKVLEEVRKKIKSVDPKELTMTDKKLEEMMMNQKLNPYPKVRFTERPDILAVHLYQGLVGIIVDTSPSVMVVPTTYFEQIQHVEEYRHTPIVGSFLRFFRTMGIFGSLFLVPIWLMFVLEPELLPKQLEFIGPNEVGNIPIVLQILIAEVGIEFLRMAAIHTPTALTTAMGIVAGILVGQIAVEVGLFTPEVVLYVAVSSLGSYATPSYELSIANKIYKLVLIILTWIWGIYGLVGGFLLNTLFLAFQKSFGKPYLYPVLPFNLRDFFGIFFRIDQKTPDRNKQGK